MLESLGYAEAAAPDDADLILFNTCSIREKADSRFVAHLHQAKALKRGRPDRIIGVGGLLGAVGQGRGLPPVPVRGRGLRPRPGAQARRVPDVGLAERAGLLRVRGLHGPPAGQARARVPGLGADLGRLQLRLLLLHRAVDAWAGGQPPVRRARRRGRAARRRRGARGDAARAERQLLRSRPRGRERTSFAELLGALDAVEGIERIRYTSPHPKDMREDVVRAHAELAALCEHIHLPLQSGSSRILKRMRRTYYARALPRPRRADPRARPRRRADHRHHRRLPRRDRGGLRARRSRSCEEVGYDGAFTFIFSPRRGTEAADAARTARAPRGGGGAHGAPRGGRAATRRRARPALRRPHARRARRGRVAHRSRRACAGARATTRS